MNKEQVTEFEKKLLEKRQGIAHSPAKALGLTTDSNSE